MSISQFLRKGSKVRVIKKKSSLPLCKGDKRFHVYFLVFPSYCLKGSIRPVSFILFNKIFLDLAL